MINILCKKAESTVFVDVAVVGSDSFSLWQINPYIYRPHTPTERGLHVRRTFFISPVAKPPSQHRRSSGDGGWKTCQAYPYKMRRETSSSGLVPSNPSNDGSKTSRRARPGVGNLLAKTCPCAILNKAKVPL